MSKRYTEHDDSGVLGLGNVPAGWTTTRLKHVSAVQTGITLSGEGDLADPEWPYLRVANVQVGYVDLREIKTVRVPADKAAASLLQPGDVLMTEGGDIDKLGRGALWRGERPDMLHQNHIFAVRPSKVLDSEFLVYWLDGPVARTYFRTTAKQTTNLAGTNKWTLRNLPVPMPPLKDQRAIADYLDRETARIDRLIEEQQRLIEMLRERRHTLVDGVFGDQLPNVRLQNACVDVVDCMHTTPEVSDDGEYEAVRTASVRNGEYRPGNGLPVDTDTWKARNAAGAPTVGDVLFTREAPAGEACMVPSDRICLGQRMVLLRIGTCQAVLDTECVTPLVAVRPCRVD